MTRCSYKQFYSAISGSPACGGGSSWLPPGAGGAALGDLCMRLRYRAKVCNVMPLMPGFSAQTA